MQLHNSEEMINDKGIWISFFGSDCRIKIWNQFLNVTLFERFRIK